MELIVKHFSELSAEELFEIYKLRISVIVVEQIEPLIMCGSKMKPESKPMHGCCRRV